MLAQHNTELGRYKTIRVEDIDAYVHNMGNSFARESEYSLEVHKTDSTMQLVYYDVPTFGFDEFRWQFLATLMFIPPYNLYFYIDETNMIYSNKKSRLFRCRPYHIIPANVTINNAEDRYMTIVPSVKLNKLNKTFDVTMKVSSINTHEQRRVIKYMLDNIMYSYSIEHSQWLFKIFYPNLEFPEQHINYNKPLLRPQQKLRV